MRPKSPAETTPITENAKIVALWKRARARNEAVYLATVVHVSGSSYRKPGARMLVTAGGKRAGSISGGCLESEVSRRIAWLTQDGPSLQQYRSSIEDEDGPAPAVELGCGGTIFVWMEAGEAATAVLSALEDALERRSVTVAVTTLQGRDRGTRTLPLGSLESICTFEPQTGTFASKHAGSARRAAAEGRVIADGSSSDGEALPDVLYLPLLPPPRLFIYGAGDDARPLARFAAELGWRVAVADGRSHLLHAERFPEAAELTLLAYRSGTDAEGSSASLETGLDAGAEDFVVVLTHSLFQDRALLRELLPRPLRYLGLLGPTHRTQKLVEELAAALDLNADECLAKLHSPIGLNLGGGGAAVIALAIVSEMQAILANTTGSIERNGHDASLDSTKGNVRDTLAPGAAPAPDAAPAPAIA